MTLFLAIITPFLIILAVVTLVDLFRHDYDGWLKVAWIAFIVLIPVIGSVAYWVTRQRRRRQTPRRPTRRRRLGDIHRERSGF